MLILSGVSFLYWIIRFATAWCITYTKAVLWADTLVIIMTMVLSTTIVTIYQIGRPRSFELQGMFKPTPLRVRFARTLLSVELLICAGALLMLLAAKFFSELQNPFLMIFYLTMWLIFSTLNLFSCAFGYARVTPYPVRLFMEDPISPLCALFSKKEQHKLRQGRRAEERLASKRSGDIG